MERDNGDHETFWSAQCSLSSSTSNERDEQQSSPGAEGAVFVALADDPNEGMSTLLWAMQNLARDGSRVVIAYVRSPTRSTHKSKPAPHFQWDKAGKNMDEYALTLKRATKDPEVQFNFRHRSIPFLPLATSITRIQFKTNVQDTRLSQIDCGEVVIEMDDVAEGLAQLIAIHGITKLVMGAAADQHYSKYTSHHLASFLCRYREMNENLPAISWSLSELQQATKCFDIALKIGEGGSGRVYKGFLRNTTVAIKLLHCQRLQGQQEFHQEVAFLSTVRHPNIMMFIGACQEASGSGLVYEFLPNGSLEEHLSCKKKKNTPPLTWQVRTRIIGEIWSALTFIHSHKPLPIVHGDLKPDNILLDANFVSKLRICQVSKNPRATKNTKDPKFSTNEELTPQCDVYSFGIIILRLLTGRSLQKIIATVEKAMEKGHLHSIIDDSAGSWPYQQADQLARLGLRCANLSGKRRPDLIGGVWGVIEPLMKAASLNAGRPSFAASSDDTHTPSSFVNFWCDAR